MNCQKVNEIVQDIFYQVSEGNKDILAKLMDAFADAQDQLLDQGIKLPGFSILDRYPARILRNEKLEQIEIFYDKLTKKDIKNHSKAFQYYLDIEKKYTEFMKVLWLISDQIYGYYFVDDRIQFIKHYLKKSRQNVASHSSKGYNLHILSDDKFLEDLVKLAVSDRMMVYFIVPEKQLLMISNGTSFALYINDQSYLTKIAMTEGLYIR